LILFHGALFALTVFDLELNSNYIVAATNTRGVFRCPIAQTALSVIDNELNQTSCFPNPSTGIFTVNVPDQTNIQASVFDALGKLVTTSSEKGSFTLDLSEVPVGIYTLRLDTESGTVTKKLVRE
jgi:hypothetical protein